MQHSSSRILRGRLPVLPARLGWYGWPWARPACRMTRPLLDWVESSLPGSSQKTPVRTLSVSGANLTCLGPDDFLCRRRLPPGPRCLMPLCSRRSRSLGGGMRRSCLWHPTRLQPHQGNGKPSKAAGRRRGEQHRGKKVRQDAFSPSVEIVRVWMTEDTFVSAILAADVQYPIESVGIRTVLGGSTAAARALPTDVPSASLDCRPPCAEIAGVAGTILL